MGRLFVVRVLSTGLAAFCLAGTIVRCIEPAARGQQVVIKDGRSSPGCIVGPLDRSRKIEGGFSVQIRAPGVSRPEVVQRLPGGLGAFTALPVRVSLLDKSGAVPKRFPIVVDGAPKHPVIDGVTSAEPFISVVFPKAWLSPGMVIHAERSVIGTDGVRITSQTTCAITEGDVAKWR